MTLRIARHTDNIEKLVKFYVEIIGLSVLGKFEKHADYNGVFLGIPEMDWHIEFTESNESASHYPDRDDLLVFYAKNDMEFNQIKQRIEEGQIPIVKSKNPYWNQNGIEITDPDGFGIIITEK